MGSISLNLDKESPKEKSTLKGKKIFIVEDDVFLGNVLSKRMMSQAADVKLFKNGEEALEAINKDTPDIILLDILLPGMDGFKVLQIIRNNEKTKNIPVLIVSNTSQLENREKAKNLGAKFLMKALVTPYEIVEEVEKMLEEHI